MNIELLTNAEKKNKDSIEIISSCSRITKETIIAICAEGSNFSVLLWWMDLIFMVMKSDGQSCSFD